MKKSTKITLGAIAAVSALYVGGIAPVAMPSGLVGSAYAESISIPFSTLTTVLPEGLGTTSFEMTDTSSSHPALQSAGIHYVEVVANVDSTFTDKILASAPGAAGQEANLSNFYIGIKLNGYATKVHEMASGKVTAGTTDITTLKNAAIANLENPEGDQDKDYDTRWETGVKVQYYKDGAWQSSNTLSEGGKTIRKDLEEKLGTTELVYGKNWRVYLDETKDTVIVFRDNTDPENPVDEFVVVSYTANFPINATIGDDNTYRFINFDDALEAGATKIVINKNVTTGSYTLGTFEDYKTLTIPAGTTVEIAANKTLTVDNDLRIKNNGTIKLGDGAAIKNEAGASIYNTVTTITKNLNGTSSSETTTPIFQGEEVSYKLLEAPESYVTKMEFTPSYLYLYNSKFTMPASAVTITYEFVEADEVEINAETNAEGEELISSVEDEDTAFGTTSVETLLGELKGNNDIKDLLATNDSVSVRLQAWDLLDLYDVTATEYLEDFDSEKLSAALKKIGATTENVEGIYSARLIATGDNDGRVKRLSELNGTVTLAVKLPDDTKETDKFYIVRIHYTAEGSKEVEVIDVTVDDDLEYATFQNDRFSDFILVRIDGATISDKDGDGDIVIDGPIDEDEDKDEAGVGNQGAFTNLEKSSTETTNSSSLVAAIAAVIAVAIASISKLFKKGEQEQ